MGIVISGLPGCPSATSEPPDTDPPSEVSGLVVVSGDASIVFSWVDPPDLDLDHVEVLVLPETTQRTMVLPETEHVTIGNLINGTEYDFSVLTVDSAGNRSGGTIVTGTPGIVDEDDTTAPGPVTDLTASAGDRQAAFGWRSPTDPDCTTIRITHDQTGGDTPIRISRSRTSIVYAGIENGVTYEFSFVTEDLAGNLSESTSVSVTPSAAGDGTAPGPVENLSAVVGDSQLTLAWTNPGDSDINYLEFSDDAHGISFTVPPDRETITLGGLTNQVDYTITVVVVDADGNRSETCETSGSPAAGGDVVPPDPVTDLTAAPSPGVVTLSWLEPTVDIAVIRIENETTEEEFLISPGADGAVIGGLSYPTEYTFAVSVIDAAGNSSTVETVTAAPLEAGDETSPQSVTGFAAVPGDGQVSLSWTDPDDSDLAHVLIVDVESGVEMLIESGREGVVIGGLTNGDTCTYRALAVDTSGNRSAPAEASAIPVVTTDIVPPDPVDVLTATGKPGVVVLSWTEPTVDIAAVRVRNVTTGEVFLIAPGANGAVIGGLDAGTTYTFQVSVVDPAGNSSTTVREASAAPQVSSDITATGPVTGLTATGGNAFVLLEWTDPSGAGNADLDHIVVHNTTAGDAFVVSAGEESVKIGGLSNGTTYSFTLLAVDATGNESISATTSATPVAPTDVTAPGEVSVTGTTAGDTQVTITWTDPTGTANADFTHVVISHNQGPGTIVIMKGVGAAVVAGLTNDTAYIFTLRTVDTAGNTSAGVTTGATPVSSADLIPPGDVTITGTTPGDRQVTITWTDPVAADFSHVLITNDQDTGSIVIMADTENVIIAGLVNDTEYTFTIKAVDSSGNPSGGVTTTTTPFSSADVTPPTDVTGLTGTPGDAQATLEWADPTQSGDEDLDRIEITSPQFPVGAVTVIAAGEESVVFAGLVNGTTYTFTVKAVDGAGNASEGVTTDITPTGVLDTTEPGIVTEFTASAGDTFVSLNWDDPGDTDLSYIRITNNVTADIIFVPNGIESAVIGGLTNGTPYTFTAKAVDTAGNLSDPQTASATPVSGLDETPPGNVSGLAAAAGNARVALSWTDPVDGDLNHIEVTHDGTGGSAPMVVAKEIEGVTIYGLTNGIEYTFTVAAVDQAGNHSSTPPTVSETPSADVNEIDLTIDITVPGDETITFGGEVATLYFSNLQTQMTVSATLSGATGWEWYLDGTSVSTGSSSYIVYASQSYTSPNPPYPLAAGVHSLVVVAEKNGMLYSADLAFSVANNN